MRIVLENLIERKQGEKGEKGEDELRRTWPASWFDFCIQVCYNMVSFLSQRRALSVGGAVESIKQQEDKLANLKSSLKRIRSSRRKAAHNQVFRSTARTYVKKARRLIAQKDWESAEAVVRQAMSALDKAAQKGVIHQNNAARRKSRLMALYNQVRKEA